MPRTAPRSPPDHRGSRPPVTLKCSPAATLPPEARSRYPLPVRSSAGPDLCPAKITGIRPFRPPRRGRSRFVRTVPLLLTRDPPFGADSASSRTVAAPPLIWVICALPASGWPRRAMHPGIQSKRLRLRLRLSAQRVCSLAGRFDAAHALRADSCRVRGVRREHHLVSRAELDVAADGVEHDLAAHTIQHLFRNRAHASRRFRLAASLLRQVGRL